MDVNRQSQNVDLDGYLYKCLCDWHAQRDRGEYVYRMSREFGLGFCVAFAAQVTGRVTKLIRVCLLKPNLNETL